jgi:hypothetical protein
MIFADNVGPILAQAEGCPEIVAVDALRNAVIDFCKASYCWNTGVTVLSDATTDGLINTEFHVLDIVDARIADKAVAITFANADDCDIDPSSVDYVIRFIDPNTFDIEPTPTPAIEIELFVVVAPKPTATVGPAHVWDEWHEGIRHGAIGRLLGMVGKPWSNPQAAAMHLGAFEAAKKSADIKYSRNRRNRGRVLRVRPA